VSLIPATITGPILGWAVLGAFVIGGAGGAYGGYRWAEAAAVKCELKAEKKQVAQDKANATEGARQTAASNRAARGLEADRGDIRNQFAEVRNEQTETALAQPDRANLVCFDDEWLRMDAAATRAANERGTDKSGPAQAVRPTAGAEKGNGSRSAGGPDAPGGAVRRLPGDPPAAGRVDQAARNPEAN
jgi:hypothetical protein